MLHTRLLFGTLMIVALLSVLVVDQWFAPYYPCFALCVGTIVWLAGREMGRLLSQLGVEVCPNFCGAGCLAIILSNWPAHLFEPVYLSAPNFILPFFVFTALGMLAFLQAASVYRGPGDSVRKIEAYVLTFFYIGCLGSFIVQTRWMGGGSKAGALTFFIAVFAAKLCDTGAYFTGRMLGRNKLAPVLSPGKTWEGSIGGALSGVVLAVVAVYVGQSLLGYMILSPWAAAGFGLLVALAAQAGDLMESLIKRDCRQKDSSDNIPGFGGLLDVIDSILFSGPVAYALFRLAGL